jgi:SAM-dependent methyltransferase
MTERDYVLGTHDEEIERLGLQHLVWRPPMLEACRRAGITRGSRVLDIGAGPGYAATDLAEIVEAQGEVVAIERSQRFAAAARQRCVQRGLTNVRVQEADLMSDSLMGNFDAAWCRWVACFVSSPEVLVEKLATVVRPAGVVIFHEYCGYESWRVLPPRESFGSFVAQVMATWRDTGGEPNISLVLPSVLRKAGFDVRDLQPVVFGVRPSDFLWQWPAAFVRSGVRRLRDLGPVDSAWTDAVLRDFEEVEREPSSLMITPLVLEIIAERVR